MCLEFKGTGAGLGRTPLSTSTQYAMVTDECPGGCAGRHLDLAAPEDGVWDVEWSAPLPICRAVRILAAQKDLYRKFCSIREVRISTILYH